MKMKGAKIMKALKSVFANVIVFCVFVVLMAGCGSKSSGDGSTGGSSSDTTAPSIPTGLTAAAASSSSTQINLTWTASTDNVAVKGYKVYRAGTYLNTITSGVTTSDSGLTAATNYCYTVSSIDAANNESQQSVQTCASTNPAAGIFVPNAADWTLISTGNHYQVAMKTNGTLWAWSKNTTGMLGDGTTIDKNTPVQVGYDTNWKSVSAGYSHTAAIKTDGTLWVWGDGGNGELGNGTETSSTVPMKVGTATDWAVISAGFAVNAAIKTDGTLWSWGYNFFGQIGDGTKGTDRLVPVQIGSATNWSSVTAGRNHAAAIKTDGTLWAWGLNDAGQVGDGTFIDKYSPVQIGFATNWKYLSLNESGTIAVKTDGTLWSWGWGLSGNSQVTKHNTPFQIGTDTNWKSLSISTFSEVEQLVLKNDGTLWLWNGHFDQSPVQVGTGNGWSAASSCDSWISSCGGVGQCISSAALKADGTLWTWGLGNFGLLGDGTTSFRSLPGQI